MDPELEQFVAAWQQQSARLDVHSTLDRGRRARRQEQVGIAIMTLVLLALMLLSAYVVWTSPVLARRIWGGVMLVAIPLILVVRWRQYRSLTRLDGTPLQTLRALGQQLQLELYWWTGRLPRTLSWTLILLAVGLACLAWYQAPGPDEASASLRTLAALTGGIVVTKWWKARRVAGLSRELQLLDGVVESWSRGN